MTRVLGIESSCDDTGAAVVDDGRRILSNVVASQDDLHARFRGVVPEIACRAHLEAILPVCREALDRAGTTLDEVDAVAVTNRPGLVGALLVGVAGAKALALSRGLPLVGVHHLEAHVHASVLEEPDLEPPYTSLVVSGGHTVLYRREGPLDFTVLGRTRDDAAGEAFDKVATLLDLGYPGGPAIQRAAEDGDPTAVRFKRPLLDPGSLGFSFSGLKTAVLYHLQGQDAAPGDDLPPLEDGERADVAASFQEAVVDTLVEKLRRALERTGDEVACVGGGVAANARLRERLRDLAGELGIRVSYPRLRLCTDNAAMIAGLGGVRLAERGRDDLALTVRPS